MNRQGLTEESDLEQGRAWVEGGTSYNQSWSRTGSYWAPSFGVLLGQGLYKESARLGLWGPRE